MAEFFQILSIDGGGIKGLFSAAVLAHMESDLKIKITDHFDLIVGTSTGGLLAIGLAVGLTPLDLVKFYVEKGPSIFPPNRILHLLRIFRQKYDALPLEEALKECFGEKCLSDCSKRLVIPSYNIGEDHVYLFKTPHHERLKRDWRVPLWKVGMATSAAPTFFPCFRGVNNIRLIDGGVWANNPTMVGITEAVSLLAKPLDSIKVLSLGTTNEVRERPTRLDSGGLWQWRTDAIDAILRGQSIGTHTQAIHLLGEDKICRLDPQVPDGIFKLDTLSFEALLGKAAHESRYILPRIESMFKNHIAPEFKPLYGMEL